MTWQEVVGVTLVVAALAAVVFAFCELGFWLSANQCHGWGIANDRPVRFVQFNWFTRQCVTPTSKGQWLPINQIIGVRPG